MFQRNVILILKDSTYENIKFNFSDSEIFYSSDALTGEDLHAIFHTFVLDIVKSAKNLNNDLDECKEFKKSLAELCATVKKIDFRCNDESRTVDVIITDSQFSKLSSQITKIKEAENSSKMSEYLNVAWSEGRRHREFMDVCEDIVIECERGNNRGR